MDILADVGLGFISPATMPNELSGGMRRRVTIAQVCPIIFLRIFLNGKQLIRAHRSPQESLWMEHVF